MKASDARLSPDPPPLTLDPPLYGRPLQMPVGTRAQKVVDADDLRLGIWLAANAPTQSAVGQVSAPAVTTNVCKISAMPPGLYDVTATVLFVGGSPVAGTDSTNWRLVLGNAAGGVGQTVSVLSCPAAINQAQSRNIRVSAPGDVDLFLASVAAPTGAVVYQGDLAAIPLTPVYIGLDPAVTGRLGFTGWPIGPTPQFFQCNQELWAIAPVSGDAGNLPATLAIWEVRRRNRYGDDGVPFSTRRFQGD